MSADAHNTKVIERQRRFFAGDAPGDRLVFVWSSDEQPDAPPAEHLPGLVNEHILANDGRLPDHDALQAIVAKVVDGHRQY
ncbi:MAG: hypothetical protein ACYTFO_02170, partial [Planctomycetota bacterium]